jgi:hypothetical protein
MQKNTVKTNKVKETVNKVTHILFVCVLAYFIAFLIGMFGFKYDIMHMQPIVTVVAEEQVEDNHAKEVEELGFDPDDESTWPEDYNPCLVIRTNVDND